MNTAPLHQPDVDKQNSTSLSSTPLIAIDVEVSCKKRAIEAVATLISEHRQLHITDVFNAMIQRERLGSTAIGEGVALPHGRMEEYTTPVGAIVVLKQPLEFESPDKKPVSILFGLVVPEESCDEHLTLLRSIASIAADPTALHILGSTKDPNALLQWLNNRNADLAQLLQ